MKNNCPVCDSADIDIAGEFHDVITRVNFVFKSKEEAVGIELGEIQLSYCHNCGFIFNNKFSNDLCNYDLGEYSNDQSASEYFDRYLNDLSDSLIKKYSLYSKNIVEVGCGNGSFKKRFTENNQCLGVDPALHQNSSKKISL